MKGRKMIGAAAMAAALTGGAAVGAIAGSPLASGAQEDPATTTVPEATAPATPDGQHPGPRHGHRPGVRGMKLEAAAEAIGISEDDLRAALVEGRTLAQVAEENKVDRQVVVDALVAAGNAQLDELRESLPERMEQAMDATRPNREDRGARSRGRSGD